LRKKRLKESTGKIARTAIPRRRGYRKSGAIFCYSKIVFLKPKGESFARKKKEGRTMAISEGGLKGVRHLIRKGKKKHDIGTGRKKKNERS